MMPFGGFGQEARGQQRHALAALDQRREWLDGNDRPARATIGVSTLGRPSALIEVVVTAAA
ncbi:MAG TPA: hypothetical protein VD978_34580 [Azospirillum sp.]|nr:hypothetical protein [Azospirillum sp.]